MNLYTPLRSWLRAASCSAFIPKSRQLLPMKLPATQLNALCASFSAQHSFQHSSFSLFQKSFFSSCNISLSSKYPYIFPTNNPNEKSPYPLDIDADLSQLPTKDGYYTASFYCFTPIPSNELELLRLELIKWSIILSEPAFKNITCEKLQFDYLLAQLETTQVNFIRPLQAKLALTGRIYIHDIGINAQISFLGQYRKHIRFLIENNKWLSGRIPPFNYALTHNCAFKKFHVRVRPLVATDSTCNISTLENEPTYLSPEEWHSHLASNNKILIDMRNHYEFLVGKFDGAICPDVDTFREELDFVASKYADQKDKDIYMYCTGGIRCSVAGAILKEEGFKNIKTLKGGVIAYGKWIKDNIATDSSCQSDITLVSAQNIDQKHSSAQIIDQKHSSAQIIDQKHSSAQIIDQKHSSAQNIDQKHPSAQNIDQKHFPPQIKSNENTSECTTHSHRHQTPSLFIGKNFTFDKRLGEPITSHVLANCHQCGTQNDTYTNCSNPRCNLLFIQCDPCRSKYNNTCGNDHCIQVVDLEKIKKEEAIIAASKKSKKAEPINFKLGLPPIYDYKTRVRPDFTFRKLRKTHDT
ncbi:hypothetical protein BB561_004646 [Smittium simulii]|uniref:Rhodanese domain-containing protein n=1 Tax=Smittium simulii TaxID=133385 RepID=A0A2T9YF35_9FUNG|nr:hypothetical protein BB561_004646 [Smittium simulii]